MGKTKVAAVHEGDLDGKVIEEAGEILKAGGLVAFPTETVYGLGGDALQKESSKKIYAAKGRPSDNPLIVHICKWEDIKKITVEIPETAEKLAKRFWPGPLTMILKKSDAVPPETTGGLSTVAVRMPEHKTALALIAAAGGYIAAPSANTSGKPSPTLAEHVREDLDGKIDMILDGGAVGIGLESTIVDLTEGKPTILRPGYITKEMLEAALGGEVDVDRTLLDADTKQAPKAPGMKYRHYAPKGELTIVSGNAEAVTAAIRRLAEEKKRAGETVGIICTDETKPLYQADCIASVGARTDEEAIARHLYAILRSFDAQKVTCIYSEAFSDKGIGQAIMNRLLKAAGHHVLKAEENKQEEKKMIALGSDHGGYDLKQEIKKYLEEAGYEYKDFGCGDKTSCDYPVFGRAAAEAVADGTCEKGIVICTTGIGISITANKVPGIRCALCADSTSAKLTRLHNNANVLALGAGIVGSNLALEIVKTFLETEFSGEERHQRRIDLIEK